MPDFHGLFAFHPEFYDAMTQEFQFYTSLLFLFSSSAFLRRRILRHCVMELQKARIFRGFLYDASRFALRHLASLRHGCVIGQGRSAEKILGIEEKMRERHYISSSQKSAKETAP